MLLDTVKAYLRADGSGDDPLLSPLIAAAKQYLKNAGVTMPVLPQGTSESDEMSLYELAVTIRVDMFYNGDPDSGKEKSLTGIILQIKDYGGGQT